jgi:tetratricopeptide (TPR) repeat protein
MGDLAQGVEQAERALELCKSRGLILWFPGASVTYGWALALAGRATEALPHLEAGTFVEMAGRRNFLSLMYVWWAEGLLLAGKHDDATQKIARAIELARQCHEDGYLSEALLGSARILASAEPLRLEPAVAAYHDASQHAERLGQRALLARVQLGLGQLYRRARRAGEARAHLQTAVAELEEMGLGLWLAEAEAALNAES